MLERSKCLIKHKDNHISQEMKYYDKKSVNSFQVILPLLLPYTVSTQTILQLLITYYWKNM